MVTRAYINSLLQDAQFFAPYDRAEVERMITDAYVAGLPGWIPGEDVILRRTIPLEAMQWSLWAEMQKAQLFRSLLAFATGRNLDIIGLGPPPVIRRLNEEDDDYRLRIALAHVRLSLGNLRGIEEDSGDLNGLIVNAYAAVSLNRQDVHVYVVKSNAELLTADEKRAINVYFEGRGSKISGVIITAQDPTVIPYKIVVEGVFDRTLYGEALVESRIRNSLYAYIAEQQRIGNTLYYSGLCDAAKVQEAIDTPTVQYRVPTDGMAFTGNDDLGDAATELTAQDNYTRSDLYYCLQDEDNVLITLRGINDPIS